MAVGLTVLLGWWLGVDVLKSIVPGLLTMKVNAALAFVLIGLGLILRTRPTDTRLHRLGAVPVALAIALSAAVGSQYLLGRDLGIDQWLFREPPGQIGTVWPNRMSPMTVICFILVGLAILLAARPPRGRSSRPSCSPPSSSPRSTSSTSSSRRMPRRSLPARRRWPSSPRSR